MSSRKESKQPRTEKATKEMAQNRRNILRLGALGAVAVLAANVLPGSDLRAATDQTGTRSVAKAGAQKALHTPAAGRSARKAATVQKQGELSVRKPGSDAARTTKQSAAKSTTKAAKAAAGQRQAGTRQTAVAAAKKATKVAKAAAQ
jgi:hypothetical protein